MLESPAKSSWSAIDFNRYSYCPIPLLYHALFRARKTRMLLLCDEKMRFDSGPLPIFGQANSIAANSIAASSDSKETADDIVEPATPRPVITSRSANAESTKSCAHTAGSSVAA